jgi:hypothetical protein
MADPHDCRFMISKPPLPMEILSGLCGSNGYLQLPNVVVISGNLA